jgi:hypothetical protein
MKKQISLLAGLALATSLLSGCFEYTADKSVGQWEEYDIGAIVDSKTLSNDQKAERISAVGERFFNTSGFMYADELFKLALTYRTNDAKATLYTKVLAPVMETRGLVTRIQPLAAKYSNKVQNFYAANQAGFQKSVSGRFFLNGQKDIKTEDQLQTVFDKVRKKQDELRTYVRDNKSTVLNIRPFVQSVQQPVDVIWQDCAVNASQLTGKFHRVYKIKSCAQINELPVTVDNVDLEAVQHMAAGLEVYTILATAYSFEDAHKFEVARSSREMTERQQVLLLNKISGIGKLRNTQNLAKIVELGSDMLAGLNWLQSRQVEACPYGAYSEEVQRPGNLISSGLCIPTEGEEGRKIATTIGLLYSVLSGASKAMVIENGEMRFAELSNGNVDYRTQANFTAPFRKPVQDLHSLLPTQFDSEGYHSNVGDETLGGLLPDGDASEVLSWLK